MKKAFSNLFLTTFSSCIMFLFCFLQLLLSPFENKIIEVLEILFFIFYLSLVLKNQEKTYYFFLILSLFYLITSLIDF